MYRNQYAYLCDWKNRNNRKPLIIRGARQVGKTYLVREFAEQEFDYLLEINFDETPSKAKLFDQEDIDTILQYLELDSGVPIIAGKTLIFLDEIQRTPEVIAKLRYFYEKHNDLHIITTGSLLDFILEEHTFSMPVGRVEYMYMGPMDFIEYLQATGNKPLIEFIRSYTFSKSIPDPIHQKLLQHVRTYMGIGGMPAVLREYNNTKSFRQCEMELSSILNTYHNDFSKYRKRVDPDRLQMVLEKAPFFVGKKVKYSEISRTEKSGNLKKAFHLLELARILYRVYHSSSNAIPLKAEKKENFFKLIYVDVGVMMHALGLQLPDLQHENLILANKGALAEQFIGQQWLSGFDSFLQPELFYWNRDKAGTSSEIDYVFQIDGQILPVEVKSGTTGKMKSLHVFTAEKKSPYALRYNMDIPLVSNVTSRIPGKDIHSFSLISLPLYMVSETRRLYRSVRK